MRYLFRILTACFLFFSFSSRLSAQQKDEPEDSLVRLVSGKSAQALEIDGISYRKIVGPARFLHNNTYLLCDTALWNVDARVIDAIGNVSIIQDQTTLQSERMKYFIDLNQAEFRGDIVQLQDKDNNTLRTRSLDYNTKDSVAVFHEGGSMKDKDGQIIESDNGTYDSKIKVFNFYKDVNMFTDSIFVKTNTLRYESDKSLATFGTGTNAWKDSNMLSAEAGWYDRASEVFFFRNKVHMMSEDKEGWADSLYFFRNTSDIRMFGNVQITDAARNVSALAGCADYVDSISRITLTRDPAVILETEENDVKDTVYCGAEKIVYNTVMMCDIDSVQVEEAKQRKSNIDIDPVSEFRRKAAEEAAKKAAEAAAADPNRKPQIQAPAPGPGPEDSLSSVADTISALPDSLPAPEDSLAFVSDSLAVADTLQEIRDTTKIGFLEALKNVRIFRKSMQVICDSLRYSDLDSMARLFLTPVIWNEITQQYNADSISVLIRNNAMEKASLMSNSFIHIQEDTAHYNQIKGAEMMAYFSADGELSRFDALGGASALFYIEENDALATVNKKDSKMLSAILKEGTINRIYYFDTAASDAYPVVQLSEEDRKLKGFNWTPELRPQDRYAVTALELRSSERSEYNARPRARFAYTGVYFPGYIDDIYLQISVRDSLNHVREIERQKEEQEEKLRLDRQKDSIALARLDSLAAVRADSLALQDSLKHVADSLALADSLAAADSIAALNDTSVVLTKEQLKERKIAERARKKQERISAREARWAAKDKADADREKARIEKQQAKLRAKKRKALEQMRKQAEKDAEMLQRYLERYQRRLEKKGKLPDTGSGDSGTFPDAEA